MRGLDLIVPEAMARGIEAEASRIALERHEAWLLRLQAAAMVVGCRFAVNSRVRYPLSRDWCDPIEPYELAWTHVMLAPGEAPPSSIACGWAGPSSSTGTIWAGRAAASGRGSVEAEMEADGLA